jgi:hypothetical protein
MKIRRYIIALALEDRDAEVVTPDVFEDALATGLGEHIPNPVAAIFLDSEQTVDVPDPDHRYEKHVEVWADRAEEETDKAIPEAQ